MTYRIIVSATIGNFQDGAGQIGVTPNGPIIELFQTEIVPGAQAPTQGNFNTALTNMATDLGTQIAANLSQIQGFATGGN